MPDQLLAICDACTCATPKYRYRSRSASITKAGLSEFGTPSSPPKVYRTMTQSGAMTDNNGGNCTTLGATIVNTYAGALNYARTTGALTDTLTMQYQDSLLGCNITFDTSGNCPGTASSRNAISTIGGDLNMEIVAEAVTACPADCIHLHCFNVAGSAVVNSKTQIQVTASVTGFSGSVTVNLSNEYTTAQLVADVAAAVVAASWGSWSSLADYTGTIASGAGSLRDLSTDEKTCTIREVQIEVYGKVPGNGCCFRVFDQVDWLPSGGGDFFVTGGFGQWDRVIPGGYDPADPTTWPFIYTQDLTLAFFGLTFFSGSGLIDTGTLVVVPNSPPSICDGCT